MLRVEARRQGGVGFRKRLDRNGNLASGTAVEVGDRWQRAGSRGMAASVIGARTGELATEVETWKQEVRDGEGTEELGLRRKESHRY